MKTYVLILTVLNAGGGDSNFVIDYDLSRLDCFHLAMSWSHTLDVHSTITCEEAAQ